MVNSEQAACRSNGKTDRDGSREGRAFEERTEESHPVMCGVSVIEADRNLTACLTVPQVVAPGAGEDVVAVGDGVLATACCPAVPVAECDRQTEAWERQADSRCAEREARKHSVAFSRLAQQRGVTLAAAARTLHISLRSLQRWRLGWSVDYLALCPRGRPCQCATEPVRRDVVDFLDAKGPATGLPALRQRYPDVARAELVELLSDYRGHWRLSHVRQQSELHWLRPGSVWAMDFSHPPHSIDGCYPAIFAVRDLASHQQLFWMPVQDETAETAIEALHSLFDEYGAPLVLKCDNGPGFVARAMKEFLCDRSIITLYSPPYAPWYNGAIERANRSLKEVTAHLAEKAGRPGCWTSADLHQARRESNRLARPWGAEGPVAEEVWESRVLLSMDERDVLVENLEARRRAVCLEREVDPEAPLEHRLETEIVRLALQPVLESLGYLHVTRRRITPAIKRRKCDRIM
jgi:transposase InsO family protein